MNLRIERSVELDGTVRIVLHGEADIAGRDALRTTLLREMSHAPRVVVVLDQLDYVDSSGLGALMEARDRSRRTGRPLEITPGTGHVRHVLFIAGVLEHLCGKEVVADEAVPRPG